MAPSIIPITITNSDGTVVLGEDGRMYVGVTAHEDWSNQKGRVLCLSYTETTGPSTVSPWPQRAADGAHTGQQAL